MKCTQCGFDVLQLGNENNPAKKRVGPDQDGMFYRVDCSDTECTKQNYCTKTKAKSQN